MIHCYLNQLVINRQNDLQFYTEKLNFFFKAMLRIVDTIVLFYLGIVTSGGSKNQRGKFLCKYRATGPQSQKEFSTFHQEECLVKIKD